MKKREYVVRQLARTKKKKYEQYVVTRIVNLVNDWDLKFVTQQYVAREDGYALTDLFYPQLALHIEVDEEHHKNRAVVEFDKIRERDIIEATSHRLERIDATKNLKEIDSQIDRIISLIKKQKKTTEYSRWDLESEGQSETYIKKGFVDSRDDVAFRTMVEAANCFGNSYKPNGIWSGGAKHPDKNTIIWFPKLYPNGLWDNSISADEKQIIEKSSDENKTIKHIEDVAESGKFKRVVFARVKDSLGTILYRFRGLYEYEYEQSRKQKRLIWKRVNIKVNTFQPTISKTSIPETSVSTTAKS